ncbi:MAG: 50S ribosomal protein L24 [Steroidobacteraceae bacterium]
MRKIRKGDQVVVLSGRDKGRRGTVLQVLADGTALVEGINRVKKHQKPRPTAQGAPAPGGIIDKEAPLRLCKLALWNASGKRSERVGVKRLADGKRVRFFKSNGEMIGA